MRKKPELWLAILLASVIHGTLFIYFPSLPHYQDPQPTATSISISLIALASHPPPTLRTPVTREKPRLPQPNPLMKIQQRPTPTQQKSPSHPIRVKKTEQKEKLAEPRTNPVSLPEPLPPQIKAEEKKEDKMVNKTRIGESYHTVPLNRLAKTLPMSREEAQAAIREAKPRYANNPKPTYPRIARRRGYQGTVLLRALVLVDGWVAKVEVIKSSGYPLLDNTALKTVKEWRFYPAMKGDIPVTSWVKIPITFKLLTR